MILCAEAGNAHEGNLNTAFELLERAKACGADMVKFQAGHAAGFARTPEDIPRYEKYDLGLDSYLRLRQKAKAIKIPIFFSVFGAPDYAELTDTEGWGKIAARQMTDDFLRDLTPRRNARLVASVPHTMAIKDLLAMTRLFPAVFGDGCIYLHCVTDYPAINPSLNRIGVLRNLFRKSRCLVGFSDHSVGIEKCLEAAFVHKADFIEKHFTLAHDFGPLRDHEHAATPEEFRELALSVK